MKKHAFRHGCFLALVFLIGGVGVVRFAADPFMSPNAPIAAPVLVIEGWMEDEQIQEAVAWAETNGVETIYTTGGPLSQGSYLVEWKTFAEMTHARLDKMGVTGAFKVVAAPAQKVQRDRTRESARALKAAAPDLTAFNLVSSGPHTRRSWRTFRREFGPAAEIGCLALTPPDFGPGDWWRCSEGIKTMISETAAYLYEVTTGVF